MNENSIRVTNKRRAIEDRIVSQFQQVDFKQKKHRYLEDDAFWDYVFAWYDLLKHYEETEDTAIGQNMVQLYSECIAFFKTAVEDSRLHERRRDKAANAIYQLNFYLNQIMLQVQRNAGQTDDSAGRINW